MSIIFDTIKHFLQQHDAKIMLAWGRPLLQLPGGISILSTTNGLPINVASRHPRGSITWTWSLWWCGGLSFELSRQKPMWRSLPAK
jgi:hypothetical protein